MTPSIAYVVVVGVAISDGFETFVQLGQFAKRDLMYRPMV